MTDDPTGLVYLRARYYHPTSGTFLTQDPVMGVVGGPTSTFNPYLYVRGNPVNLTDPSGRIAPLLLAGAAALVGGLVGGIIGAAGDLIHQLQQNGGNLGCIDRGQMLREGLKGLIAGAAGGLAFAAAVTGAIGAAVTAIAGAVSSLAAWAGGILTAAGAAASGLLQRAWSGLSSAASWVGSQISSAWQGVSNWVSSVGRSAYQPILNMDPANCMLLEVAVVGADIPGCGLAGSMPRSTLAAGNDDLADGPHQISPLEAAKTINPTGDKNNCINCTFAFDNTLEGYPTSALPSAKVKFGSDLEAIYNSPFELVYSGTNPLKAQQAIDANLSGMGQGARGIVIGLRGNGVGHAWNVVEFDGKILSIDPQSGRIANYFGGYTEYYLLISKMGDF